MRGGSATGCVPNYFEAFPRALSVTTAKSVCSGNLCGCNVTPEIAYLQLLCKAGYRGAGGLGAQEQGVTSPLKAWRQAGKQGIGRPKREAILQAETTGKTSSELVVPLGVKARSAVSCSNSCEDEKMRRAQIKRKWPSVNVEESVDAKKRPWRQVLQVRCSGDLFATQPCSVGHSMQVAFWSMK